VGAPAGEEGIGPHSDGSRGLNGREGQVRKLKLFSTDAEVVRGALLIHRKILLGAERSKGSVSTRLHLRRYRSGSRAGHPREDPT
jgi:hypothetical protein